MHWWKWITSYQINFWTGCPEIKAVIFWWNFEPCNSYFILYYISLFSPSLTFFFSYRKTIKLNYSKLHAILKKYDLSGVQCPFNQSTKSGYLYFRNLESKLKLSTNNQVSQICFRAKTKYVYNTISRSLELYS